MLRADTGSLTARERDRKPGMLAFGISLGLHGAALACFFLFREETPPQPYAVIALELVQAADVGNPGEDAGQQARSSRAIETRMPGAAIISQDPDQPADGRVRGEKPIARDPPSESDGFSVERVVEPTPVSAQVPTPRNTSDRRETVPPTPTEPSLAAENSYAPEDSTEAMRPIPPTPPRKPLTLNSSTGSKAAKTRIKEKFAETKDRSLRPADQKAAREVAQSDADRAAARTQQTATLEAGKDHGAAAVPAAVRNSDLVGGLGDGPGALPRYAGGSLLNAPPRYPYLARRRSQEGRVVLRIQVSAGGDAAAVRIRQSSGYRLLDDAAVEAVKTWRFVPASRGGNPVAGSVDVPVSFKLTD